MSISRRSASTGALALAATVAVDHAAHANDGLKIDLMEGLDHFALAVEAYTFGYPLVTMEMTRRVITNVAAPVGTRGPMGQLIKLRQYPDATFRDVTAPKADTLYTSNSQAPPRVSPIGNNGFLFSRPRLKLIACGAGT